MGFEERECVCSPLLLLSLFAAIYVRRVLVNRCVVRRLFYSPRCMFAALVVAVVSFDVLLFAAVNVRRVFVRRCVARRGLRSQRCVRRVACSQRFMFAA